MDPKLSLARLTIDLSQEKHRKLKAQAALLGKTMRELVLEAIEEYLKRKNSSLNTELKK